MAMANLSSATMIDRADAFFILMLMKLAVSGVPLVLLQHSDARQGLGCLGMAHCCEQNQDIHHQDIQTVSGMESIWDQSWQTAEAASANRTSCSPGWRCLSFWRARPNQSRGEVSLASRGIDQPLIETQRYLSQRLTPL